MKVVSVILARGGSKGIPKKNIIDINGYPLIWYAINASLKSSVSETWVSTDDAEIKAVSLEYGAQVLDRPKEYALDTSQSEEALLHFAENVDFDVMLFIQPTSVLIRTEYINKGIEIMRTGEYDSAFTAYQKEWDSVWSIDVEPIGWDIYNRPRRQDVNPTWIEDGMLYCTTKEGLLKSKLRYSGKMAVIEIKKIDSFEIDNYDDIKLTEELLQCRKD